MASKEKNVGETISNKIKEIRDNKILFEKRVQEQKRLIQAADSYFDKMGNIQTLVHQHNNDAQRTKEHA